MKKLMIVLLLSSFGLTGKAMKIDFGSEKDGISWMVINDGVMGGLSQGAVKLTNSSAILTGRISLENNGGFSAFRSSYDAFDLSAYKTVKIRYKLNGMACAFVLDVNRQFYLPNYKSKLPKTDGNWETIQFNLLEFQEEVLGKSTGNRLTKNQFSEIIRIGFITAEKRESDFELEVDWIEFLN